MNRSYLKPATRIIIVNAKKSYLLIFDPNQSTDMQLSIRPGDSSFNEADLL